MIHVDLSKVSSLRPLVYMLALFPGLFFLVSVALGNPCLAKAAIQQVEEVNPLPPYALLILLLVSALVIGQAFVLASWILEMLIIFVIRLPKATFRKIFAANWIGRWLAKHQAAPPGKSPLPVRAVAKLNFLAYSMDADPADARVVRGCLGAAVEKLLERRYGIDAERAGGPDGEWGVWYSVLGKPIPQLRESLNAARIVLASGLAGFCALGAAPNLVQRYFIAMCSVFTFCGLWTPVYNFLQWRNPVNKEVLTLRCILLELQELSPESKPGGISAKGDAR
jgi:hypothetical protein